MLEKILTITSYAKSATSLYMNLRSAKSAKSHFVVTALTDGTKKRDLAQIVIKQMPLSESCTDT